MSLANITKLHLLLGLSIAGVAIACAPQKAPSTLVVSKDTEHEEEKSSERQKSEERDGLPSTTQKAPLEDEEEGDAKLSPPDASDRPPETTTGPICTALEECCKELEAAGYMTDKCRSFVNDKNEMSCSLWHKNYRDNGDCS